MTKFKPGQTVQIRCDVQRGAFPTELLVTFDTVDGPVSGFVRSESVTRSDGHKGYVPGVVKEVGADVLAVVVKGSFFTTTGLAYFKRDWANVNVQPVAA